MRRDVDEEIQAAQLGGNRVQGQANAERIGGGRAKAPDDGLAEAMSGCGEHRYDGVPRKIPSGSQLSADSENGSRHTNE